MTAVIWHDLECGAYRHDLRLWLALADQHPGLVLDVGAGTGRVTLALARAGHPVIALDADADLLDELQRRSGDLPIRTLRADARDFTLPEPVALCLVPMQTIQLLGGPEGRAAFLGCARRHLAPGGVIAMAIADQLDPFEVSDGDPGPLPDLTEREGVVYCSQPTVVRQEADRVLLERRRERVDPHGIRQVSVDRIFLDCVSVGELRREGERLGLRSLPTQTIPATEDHVGSQVVILDG